MFEDIGLPSAGDDTNPSDWFNFDSSDAGPFNLISHDFYLPTSAVVNTEAVPFKRFPCTQSGCIKSFTRNADLRRHMRIHRTEPSNCAYYCPYKSCHRSKHGGRSFYRRDKLLEHIKHIHEKHELREVDIMIVCTSPIEYDAIRLAFDENWEQDRGEHNGSASTSRPPVEGLVCGYNVILYIFLPDQAFDAMIAAIARHPTVSLALVIHLSKPPPQTARNSNRIRPGDLVLSKTSCQKEIDSRYSEHPLPDRIKGARNNIKMLLDMLSTSLGQEYIQKRIYNIQNEFQVSADQQQSDNVMYSHTESLVHIVSSSDNSTRLEGSQLDRLYHESPVSTIGEYSNIQEEMPCIIVKSVYGINGPQHRAAAIAASVAKGILEWSPRLHTIPQPIVMSNEPQPHWNVPFGRNKDFVGRETVLERLLRMIPPSLDMDDCQQVVIEGLGGIGKTHIAIEVAYRVRIQHPDCSVFWVLGMTIATFESAYREIGQALNIQGIDKGDADIQALVKTALSADNAGWWLMIIDNADDLDLLFSQEHGPLIRHFLPFSRKGSILFTTRNHELSARLDIPIGRTVVVEEMTKLEARKMLQNSLDETQLRDAESTEQLLDYLTHLPLAIRQASSYMTRMGMPTTKYLYHCSSSENVQLKVLSYNFGDRYRYTGSANNILTIWCTTFDYISRNWPLAMQYLTLMSYLAEKNIPLSLLPSDDEIEVDEAVGVLKGYSFITEQETQRVLNIHRLVQLAMRNNIKSQGDQEKSITLTIKRLSTVFPNPDHSNRNVCLEYLPHAQNALRLRNDCRDNEATWELLFKVGSSHLILGEYVETERAYQQTLDFAEKVWGRQDSRTVASRKELLLVRDKMGVQIDAEEIQ